MRITKISTILTCPDRNYLIVKILTDEGLVGYGDATLNGRELAVKATIEEHLAVWLVGLDVDRVQDIWQMIVRHTYWRGGPVFMTALAGIDMALWDIKGKRFGAPLYSLLGGKCRDRLTAYTHVHGRNDSDLMERSLERVASGSRVLRYSFDTQDPLNGEAYFRQPHQDLSTGRRIEVSQQFLADVGTWDSDVYISDLIRITALLREAVGSSVALIHDVHGRLSPIQAARAARQLEPYGLLFLEDPVEPMAEGALDLIRRYSTTALAMGELYTTMTECMAPVQNQLIDYLRVDISHFGGITAVKKVADFCSFYGVKLACHGPTDISPLAYAATIHVDYAVHNFGVQEYAYHGDRTYEVFDVSYTYDNGSLGIGESPGLGVAVDETAALQYPYQPSYLPGLRDRDGAVHNW